MNLNRKMTIRLSDAGYERLVNYAQANGLVLGHAVREVLMSFLDVLERNAFESKEIAQTKL